MWFFRLTRQITYLIFFGMKLDSFGYQIWLFMAKIGLLVLHFLAVLKRNSATVNSVPKAVVNDRFYGSLLISHVDLASSDLNFSAKIDVD